MMKLQSASKLRRAMRLRPVVLALMSAGCVSAAFGVDLPQNMTLKAGDATVLTTGSTMTTTQTSKRAVWESTDFSIAKDFSFVNNALNGGLTLVRVVGSQFNGGVRSLINGSLKSNNHFMLVNPFGISVGSSAVINTAALTMSAKDLSADLYSNGQYTGFMNATHIVFDTNGGWVTGYGGYGNQIAYGDATIDISPGAQISADGGSIFLIADNVRNQGALSAAAGSTVALLAVPSAEFDVGDSGFITLSKYANFDASNQDFTNRVAVNTGPGTIDTPNGTVMLVGVGRSNESNHFQQIDSQNDASTAADGLYTSGVDGSSGSGAFNSGTITANGANGKIMLVGQGPGSIAATTGKLDVSSLTSKAGAISMSAETVRVGLFGGDAGELRADGVTGGGTVDLGDTAPRQKGDTTSTKWIYVSGAAGDSTGSTLSASATNKGDGGTVKLQAMYAVAPQSNPDSSSTPQARIDYGQVEVNGSLLAQGGTNGGSGGTINTFAQSLSVGGTAKISAARRQLSDGVNGLWEAKAPYMNIGTGNNGYGSHYEPSQGESWIDPNAITNALTGGTNVTVTASSNGTTPLFNDFSDIYLYVESGTQISSSGLGQRMLALSSDGHLSIENNTSITAGDGGPLDIELTAKGGGLFLYGYEYNDGEGGSGSFPVTISTNGGNLTLNGATSTFEEGPSAGVYISTSHLDTGSQGLLTITGTGEGQTGVQIEGNTTLSGNQVRINGVSQTGTGVSLNDTTITGVTSIDVHGLSKLSQPLAAESPSAFLKAESVSVAQVSTGPAGVDIGSNVVFNLGQGQATILGRSASGDGVRIRDLTVTTSGLAAVRQRITIAGESVDGGTGVNVLANAPGIQMHEEGGTGLAFADVVIGGTADNQSQPDIELGTPQWNTTGSVNFRPLAVSEGDQGIQLVDSVGRSIHVGTADSAQPGDFLVNTAWFNPSVNHNILANTSFVIGSSGHTGKITVADGALDGAGTVTLQNQGAGSLGIKLGSQQSFAQALNLVTTGPITQTGPMMVNALRVIPGPDSVVALNDPANQIGNLSYNNQPANVSPVGVAAAAPLANGSAAGILSYNSQTGQFQYLEITNRADTPSLPVIPRPFEGPDALNDLRTDVYVHGQLGRPQICTAANTTGGATGPDGGAEPLALEWLKVRRSAQLSNCSGVRTDNSCSAF